MSDTNVVSLALGDMRETLRQDGYELVVTEAPEAIDVVVQAGPDACSDCLVPKSMMLMMMEAAVPAGTAPLRLRYPGEDAT